MRKITISVISILVATVAVFAGDSGPNLDVAGLKIGMGVHDAMAALKAENPQFRIDISSHRLEGFSAPLHPSVTAGQNISPTNDGESMELLFTMPPNKEQVWGIQRHCSYLAQNRPATENTIAALRKKYGPENIPPGSDPMNQHLTWIYDADGKLLPAGKAKEVLMSCATILQNHFNAGDMSALNELTANVHIPPECGSITLMTADVQSTRLDIRNPNGPYVVVNLIVQISDSSMYFKTINKTREIAVNAANARENKAADDASKRGPKL